MHACRSTLEDPTKLKGRAELEYRIAAPIDSIAFGAAGSALDGLLLASSNLRQRESVAFDAAPHESALWAISLASRSVLQIARGGTRGEAILATNDGRILLAQTNGIDEVAPAKPPRVTGVSVPEGSLLPLPASNIAVQFDQAMFVAGEFDAGSVLNPLHYELTLLGMNADGTPADLTVVPHAVAWNASTRTAQLDVAGLEAGVYQLRISRDVLSASGTPMDAHVVTTFTAVMDLTAEIRLDFANTRAERATGSVSYDITVTNIGTEDLRGPLMLLLDPGRYFGDRILGTTAGQHDLWVLDLSAQLAANGNRLSAGQTLLPQTITVVPAGSVLFGAALPKFDLGHGIYALPLNNTPPELSVVTQDGTGSEVLVDELPPAAAGEPWTATLEALDVESGTLFWQLLQAPAGMTLLASETGIDDALGHHRRATLQWTPDASSPADGEILLRLQDTRGGVTLRRFTLEVAGGNHAPTIDFADDIVLAEGESLVLPLIAADEDADAITLTVRNLPAGATFDAATGVLGWTPGYDQAGQYDAITVIATDGKRVTRRSFSITVTQGYAQPKLLPIANQTLREGDAFALQLAGSMSGGLEQADGTTIALEYSAPWLPAGARLNRETGWLEWTPGFAQHGTFEVPITLTATSAAPGSDETVTTQVTQRVVFNVLNANGAPVFEATETWSILEGSPLQVSVFAFDPDNPAFEPKIRLNPLNPDALAAGPETTPATVSYDVTGLPPGARFDAETMEILWTPAHDQAGTYYVRVVATDDGDGTGMPKTSEVTIPIVVSNANRAPVIGEIVSAFVDKGAVLEIPFSAEDIDGDPITLTVAGVPSFATVTYSGNGGTIRFAPGEGHRGDYTIVVTAQDNGGGEVNQVLASSRTFVVSVRSASEAPQIAMPDQVVAVVGQALSVPISVRDLDQDALSFGAIDLPVGATLTPLPTYGQALLTWTPTADDVRVHDLSIIVTDTGAGPTGGGGAGTPGVPNVRTHALRIVVRAANSAPTLLDVTASGGTVDAPSGAAMRVNATEGVPLTLEVFAQDADADHLTWTMRAEGASAATLPVGLSLDVAPGSQRASLRWTPNLFAAQDATLGQPAGTYRIEVTASDGAAQFVQTIELRVANVNQAPRILPVPLQLVREGDTLAFSVIGADADGDATRLALLHDENTPEGVFFDAATGLLEWTPGADVVDNATALGNGAGTVNRAFTLNFEASDGTSLSTQSVQIRVFDVNRAPVLRVSNHALVVGAAFSIPVHSLPPPLGEGGGGGIESHDPDGTPSTYSFANLPEGAAYDAATRRLTWTPGPGQTGDFRITVRASDGFDSTEHIFTLRVAADASAHSPKVLVSTTPSTPVAPGQLVIASVRASSYGAIASIAVEVQGLDAGDPAAWRSIALDAAGRMRFTPTLPGLVNIRVTATDVDGYVKTATHAVRVKNTADTQAPQLAWQGALAGATSATRPVTIDALTTLLARLQEQQLMGWRLQIAPAGTSAWQTLASRDVAATAADGTVNLAGLDPSARPNGVYQLRLAAWDLQGRTSEIEARVVIDSLAKQVPRAQATDAVVDLGGHAFALTRHLPSSSPGLPPPLPLGEGRGEGTSRPDLGNWQVSGLATHLTTDQPATDDQGMNAPWTEGARVWLDTPSFDGSPMTSLRFTLATVSERLGPQASAPIVVRPVFTTSTPGWTLQAHSQDTLDSALGFMHHDAEALQRQGTRLYSQTTGLAWVPAGYTLTGPDGTRYALNAQGELAAVQFADGAQWLVTDAGIAAVGSAERLDFIRDTVGRIARITNAERSIAYRYDASGRLILARDISSSTGLNAAYGYDADGRLLQDAVTANFGASLNWGTGALADGWSGPLVAGETTSLSFVVRESEIASTIKTPGAQGAVIVAIRTQGDATVQVTGATLMSTSVVGDTKTTLVRIVEAGVKMIRVSGEGAVNVKVLLAGDANGDARIDGVDSAAWTAVPTDIDGDGVANASDRQVLYANYGFRANLAPVATGSVTAKTHTDLEARASLASVAEDLEGDSVFWRVLGATHGVASLSVDGSNVLFMPEAGYAGAATITLQADDGFAASAPIEVQVNVSGARLIAIHVGRLAALATGQTAQLYAFGDFEDEEGVLLTGPYASFDADSGVVDIDASGRVRGESVGSSILSVRARGIEAVNALTVSIDGAAPALNDDGLEVEVYPRAITLPLVGGQRQLKVTMPDAAAESGGAPINVSAASAGTRYFISDPAIADVTADGLIVAKASGSAILTVVNGGRQHAIRLNVQTPTIGSATVTAREGAAVQDTEGNLLMVAPGALPAGTRVSVERIALEDVGMPLPAPDALFSLAAVRLDLGGEHTALPLQLAIKVANPVDPNTGETRPLLPGTEVMFWRKGVVRDIDGSLHDTWWLVDNGYIDAQGYARTSSPPYPGVTGGDGVFMVSTSKVTNPNTGEITVSGGIVNFDAIWASVACIAAAPSAGVAMAAFATFALVTGVVAIKYTLNGAYKKDVPQQAFDLANVEALFPQAPNPPVHIPSITSLSFTPENRKLKIGATNVIPPEQSAGQFDVKVWLVPRGNQLMAPQKAGDNPDRGLIWQGFAATSVGGELEITLPEGVALSMHHVYIERVAKASGATGDKVAGFPVDSDPVEAWTLGTRNTLLVTNNTIHVMRTDGNTGPGAVDDSTPVLSLVGRITKDEKGQPLKLNGRFTDNIAFSADGTLAFVTGAGGLVYVVDNQTNRVVHTLTMPNAAGAGVTSLGANDGWLYVTEGSAYGASGGRLLRVNIDPLAEDFLREIEVIQFAADAPLGFADLAINNGSYLAVTAPRVGTSYSHTKPAVPGNVYVIDIGKIQKGGTLAAEKSVAVLDAAALKGIANAPRYITSGIGNAEFLLSSEQDMGRGLATIVMKVDGEGNLSGKADVRQVDTTRPRAESSQQPMGKHRMNIQRAAGNAVMEYAGKQYALVADFNLPFNDAVFLTDGAGKQFGGKIGVIQDPFGPAPKYLGSTTPIVGSSIDHLVLTEDGKLIADAMTELVPGSFTSPLVRNLYVWNAGNLIQAALDAQARPATVPIDRLSVNATDQIKGTEALRIDGPEVGESFNWTFGLGAYSVPGRTARVGVSQDYANMLTQKPVETPFVEDNVFTRMLGINDKQVAQDMQDMIDNKTPATFWSAASYVGRVVLYNGWNFMTAGFVGRQAQRYALNSEGKITDGAFMMATAVDSAASVASIAASMRIGSLEATLFGGGVKGLVGASALSSGTYQVLQKGGEIATYRITGGQAGTAATTALLGSTASEIATDVLIDSGLAFLGPLLSKASRANYKIVWNSPSTSNPLPFRIVSPHSAPGSARLLHTLADTARSIGLNVAGGKLVVGPMTIDLPRKGTFTAADASLWLQTMGQFVPSMLSKAGGTAREQALRAVQIVNALVTSARNAMRDAGAAAQWNLTQPLRTFKEAMQEVSSTHAGEPMYKKIIELAIARTKPYQAVSLPGGCFAAGTLVHTREGPKPIEDVQVGEWVLSQPEETGEKCLKRVKKTFVYEDKEIYLVRFYRTDAPATEESVESLAVTGNHPFWVKDVGWVAADQLDNRQGQKFELLNGAEAVLVCSVPLLRTARADRGWARGAWSIDSNDVSLGNKIDMRYGHISADLEETPLVEWLEGEDVVERYRTAVYNLEVEDFHTYYVGVSGVWVHNQNCAGVKLRHSELGLRAGPATPYYDFPGVAKKLNLAGPNRGVVLVQAKETTTGTRAAFEDATQGALWDKNGDALPWSLRFNNPNPSGLDYIKLGDGRVIENGRFTNTFIDAKSGNTPFGGDLFSGFLAPGLQNKLRENLTRLRKALDDNPGYSQILELEPASAGQSKSAGFLQAERFFQQEVQNGASWYSQKIMIRMRGDDMVTVFRKDASGNVITERVAPVHVASTEGQNSLLDVANTFVSSDKNQNVPEFGTALIDDLDMQDVGPVFAEAKRRWRDAGADEALLESATVQVGSLPDAVAGQTRGRQITLSPNAGGWGWFVDPTPSASEEFWASDSSSSLLALPARGAEGQIDLLTVLLHELGHVVGLPLNDGFDVMSRSLDPGMRRLLDDDDAVLLQATHPQPGLPAASVENTAATSPHAAAVHATLANGVTAWTAQGSVQILPNGRVTLRESVGTQSGVAQAFALDTTDRYITFTVDGLDLSANNGGPSDAFEVALLDPESYQSLLTGVRDDVGAAMALSDAALNIQQRANSQRVERRSAGISSVANADGSTTYSIDLRTLNAGADAGRHVLLSFDLIGFGSANSEVTLRDIRTGSAAQTVDDMVSTIEDTAVVIAALANDVDASQPGNVPSVVLAPAHGSVVVNEDGTFTYTPDPDFHGADSFTYNVGPASGGVAGVDISNTATVNIVVTPVNDAPMPGAIATSTSEDATLTLNLLGHATDVDGDALSVSVSAGDGPQHGSVAVGHDGAVVYTPDADFHGADSFTYTLSDGTASVTARVDVTVTPVNDVPTLGDVSITVREDDSAQFDPFQWAADIDGDGLTATLVTDPSHGTLILNADGTFTYQPSPNFNGSDSFTYTVSDGASVSRVATVTIEVSAVNDAPTLADHAFTVDEDAARTGDLLANASDIEGSVLTATIISQPSHGTLTLNADGTFTYQPASNFNGSDSFTYTVSDGELVSNVATVTINVSSVNDVPAVSSQSLTVDEDGTLSGELLSSAADIEGSALTAMIVSQPSHGTLTLSADGTFNYQPASNFNGTDSFTYTVSDGALVSNEATVSITVLAVNDAPTLTGQTLAVDEDGTLTGNLLASAADVEGASLTANIVSSPAHGTLTLHANGTFTYQPTANFNGTDSFTYKVSDGTLESNIATITINVAAMNDAPTLASQSLTLDEDRTHTGNLMTGAADIDSPSLSASTVSDPAHGSLTLNADGSYSYTPFANYNGSDSFTYRVSDGQLVSNVATATIQVRPVNDAPTVRHLTGTVAEDGTLTGNLLAYAADVDSGTLTAAVASGPQHGTLTLNADGSFSYRALANYMGTDSFTWRASDGQLHSATSTVTVNVVAQNDAPAWSSVPPASVLLKPAAGEDNSGVFRVGEPTAAPGASTYVLFDYYSKDSAYSSEYGIFRVDDASGRIGNLRPGDAGYAAAALALDRMTVVFASTQRAGARRSLTLAAGQHYSTYMIQNSNSTYWRSSNPANTATAAPVAFFGTAAANPDNAFQHMVGKWYTNNSGTDHKLYVAWEDLTGGGDRDYNDAVISVTGLRRTVPTFVYDARATDVDGDVLRYSLLQAPAGATIDPTTGRLSWVNPVAGRHVFVVDASDQRGGTTQQRFELTVTADAQAAASANPNTTTTTQLSGNAFVQAQIVAAQQEVLEKIVG